MAALLIIGVVAVLVLLYAADRIRQARSRARLLHAMNDRLTVAAAQIDEEQERRRAVARASAELTSVLPAIKRPPLTLPGARGPEPADAGDGQGGPGGPGGPEPGDGGGRPATPPEDGAPEAGAPEAGAPEAGAPEAGAPAHDAPADSAPADSAPEDSPPEGSAPAARTPGESTLTMPGGLEGPGESPGPRLRLTPEGTLIMAPVPVPGGGVAAAPSPNAAAQLRPGEPGGS